MQINIGHLNENGQYVDGNFTTFALAGNVRAMVRDSCYSGDFLITSVQPCSTTTKPFIAICWPCKVPDTDLHLSVLQGQGDSALDTLWKKKAEQIQQQ